MKRKCTGYVLAAGIAVSGAIVGVPGQASAQTTIYVNEGAAGGAGCGAEASPCGTIQEGYGEAVIQNADTIKVGPGTYTFDNDLMINKAGLKLEGAQYLEKAPLRTPKGPDESIITGTTQAGQRAQLWVDANDVTVDGFDFEDNGGGAGVYTDVRASGYTVSHDIFHNNLTGLLSASSGIDPSVFDENLYAENNNDTVSPSAAGDAVFDYEYLRDASFTNSTFVGNETASISLPGSTGRCENITIADNDMTGEQGIVLVADSNVDITGNKMNGGYLGVDLAGGDHTITIDHNSITDKMAGGLLVNTDYFGEPDTDITVTHNTITGSGAPGISVAAEGETGPMTVQYNRIVNSAGHQGLVNDAADAQIDARWNWWGCNDMPAGDGCDQPAGTGDTNVQFDPWLVMTIASQPSDLASTQQATITTTLNTDSGGQAQTGPFFDPPPVTFSASTGTIAPLDTTTDAALLATATWTAGQGQAGEVCAKVDNQELCLPVAEAPQVQPPVIPPVQPPVIPPVQPPVSPPARPSTPPKVSVRVAPVVKVRISPEPRVPVTG